MHSGVKPSGPGFEDLKVIGLTGGVAAGKSAVARILEAEGYPVIDADAFARSLSQPGGRAADAIQKRFGTLDRKALREIVFRDAASRRELEAILHPLIQEETAARIRALRTQNPELKVVFYEAALLIETGTFRNLDGLWIVTAPEAQRLARLQARDGLDATLAAQIVGAQMSDAERRTHAPDAVVIPNTGSVEDLRNSVKSLTASGF